MSACPDCGGLGASEERACPTPHTIDVLRDIEERLGSIRDLLALISREHDDVPRRERIATALTPRVDASAARGCVGYSSTDNVIAREHAETDRVLAWLAVRRADALIAALNAGKL